MRTFRKIAFLYFLISFLIVTGYAETAPDWHKPIPCTGCHGETLDAPYGSGECGNCHDYKLDVPLLEKDHNPKICKTCHIGETTVSGNEKELFHNGHSAVNCTRCHTEDNFTVIKIKSNGFECVSCHGAKIHSIHIQNLDKGCPICHGSWAAGKVYMKDGTSSSNKAEKDRFEKFTIFNFIRNLFNSLLGIQGD